MKAKILWAVRVVAAVVLGAASVGRAQCGEWDNRFGSSVGMNNDVYSLTTWDPDGDGPLAAQVVAGGFFITADGVFANFIARWDGAAWQPHETGMSGPVWSLATWDPDGAGPMAAQLVAGGTFTTAGGVTVNRIARWDGAAWQPFATGMSDVVFALTTWDPDGTGPLAMQLVAAGNFNTADGVTVNRIARWDGVAWQPFGSGMNGEVRSLNTWDPDGDGPMAAQLVAGGTFTTAGGVTVNRIARWDGAAWQPFGTGTSSGVVLSLTTWDPDGAGPLAGQLVAGGSFTTAGDVTVNNISRWDGATWQPLGSGISGNVFSLTTWDPDGSGPLAAQLVAGGQFITAGGVTVNRIARWDGAAWQPLGSGTAGNVLCLTTWDPDGNGPLAAQLVAGGNFSTAGGVTVNRIARWDGVAWQPFGSGMNGRVNSLTTWDPDGDGPLAAQLVAGGFSFTTADGIATVPITRWDGAAWRWFDSWMNGPVSSLITWDPDDAGPLPAQLVAGGNFSNAGGVATGPITRWDGAAWQAFDSWMNGPVNTLATWDPDGAGPLPAQPVAGGFFNNAGGVSVSNIARWDGASWQPFGSGTNNTVNSLTTWDPDGDGPLAAQLVAGGAFPNAGGVTVNNVARWDGAAWQPFGTGTSGVVSSLTTWDPDGAGPLSAQLVAGGQFTTAGGVTVNNIARWDGSAWQPFGTGTNSSVLSLTTWDSDGDGPQAAQLVAGGFFTTAGGVTVNSIARWDGAAWLSFGSGVNAGVRSLPTWDPDGDGPLAAQLVAGGDFTTAGGVAAGYTAMWSTLVPEITAQPLGDSVSPGTNVTLTVAARNGQPTYQWRKGGVNLSNGPTGSGATISGATTRTLTIANAQPTDSGDYDCIVSNTCGSVTSDVANLAVVPPSCPGDANGDSVINAADLSVLLGQFGLSVTPGSGADFNSDGLVNAADLSVLLANFGSSC